GQAAGGVEQAHGSGGRGHRRPAGPAAGPATGLAEAGRPADAGPEQAGAADGPLAAGAAGRQPGGTVGPAGAEFDAAGPRTAATGQPGPGASVAATGRPGAGPRRPAGAAGRAADGQRRPAGAAARSARAAGPAVTTGPDRAVAATGA